MNIFIGIDPSLNSTGVCILREDGSKYFAIVKPNKLTKKEQSAQDSHLYFDYILYRKTEILKEEKNNHTIEDIKTNNFIETLNEIIDTIRSNTQPDDTLYIVQEGVSYGSTLRTKSVFDLAGLNYMLRYRLKKFLTYTTGSLVISPPAEIKKFASGSGNCKKDVMVANFKLLFPEFEDLPKIDDICDAYYMARYAQHLYNKENN